MNQGTKCRRDAPAIVGLVLSLELQGLFPLTVFQQRASNEEYATGLADKVETNSQTKHPEAHS